ncbi:MAG: galactose-1-phosphate uridylyltransferase [Desulfotomaculaceae bacterium]|nr:galactose-1-phosphate uridylyltransferase [Desulfotomaculaceae bacterium]MDD4766092.1 galactose-1-phosphate uridylyltransferase [Desulfotomaculaceae bacterium]
MSEIRKDNVKNKWVSISSNLTLKPKDFPVMKVETASAPAGFCPFCEGNEAATPPEILAFRKSKEGPDGRGWLVRTIPNKFSAFALDGELEEKQMGLYRFCNGLGKHEVIIETPQHDTGFHELDLEQIEMIVATFKLRYNALAEDERIKYIQIYKNRGLFAGASLGHGHSQILGFPFKPGENDGLPQYYQAQGRCLICDILQQEQESRERIVYAGKYFTALCPYASRFAYETWIVPKRHTEHFGQLTEAEEKELAWFCKKLSMAIVHALDNPSYNFAINTAPVNSPYEPGYHWYMEFTPRLLVAAGVEVATGVYINPMAPEDAAPVLRESWDR